MQNNNWLLKRLLCLQLLLVPATALFAQDFDLLSLDEIASGLTQPIGIFNAGDGSGRVFIIEQPGRIRVYQGGALEGTPFLDITEAVDSAAGEQGLLGLAFHPNYESNGCFYVNYTRDPGPGQDLTVVARYSVSAGNADIADANSELKLLEITQNASNHNGGDMHFGPDGYLYIAMGDGGGANDQYDNAQDLNSLKGKMLRINVDDPDQFFSSSFEDPICGGTFTYSIPVGNPFVGLSGRDEIWSYGLRNPWRFSFDRDTGDMFIGDVGQNTWEEIDFEPSNTSGRNYGWSCREGAHDFDNGNACIGETPTDPILEFSSASGSSHCSVTGGYMYRGVKAGFNGYYFYGDYCSDVIWLASDGGGSWSTSEWPAAAAVLGSIASFGEDGEGELYVADRNNGKVYKILIEDPP